MKSVMETDNLYFALCDVRENALTIFNMALLIAFAQILIFSEGVTFMFGISTLVFWTVALALWLFVFAVFQNYGATPASRYRVFKWFK